MLALDPKAFRAPGDFEEDVDAMIDVLHETAPIDPSQPVLVAGDPEEATRQHRLREGIPIPDTLLEKLRGVCERNGAPFLLAN
jgi:LDH2 family malate/lactate/ureidoglycolate dehydrogenase